MKILVALMLVAGCRLDPLVDDTPGASVFVLPPGTEVPRAADDPTLVTQIALNDGLDDRTLEMAGGVIARGTGWADGVAVTTWSFGATSRTPAPIYVFYQRRSDDTLERIDHPYLVAAMPGDASYRPIVAIQQVVVTADYDGELITTMAALSDARDLGIVEEPLPAGMFFNAPIVAPGTTLDIGTGTPAAPIEAYARGYRVDMFQLGGNVLGVQPLTSYAPTTHISYLREAMKATYDAARPIFQAKLPTEAPTMKANYTPVSVVVNVDLAPGITASSITRDADLFTRSMTGAITGTTANVATFAITTTTLDIQTQLVPGAP